MSDQEKARLANVLNEKAVVDVSTQCHVWSGRKNSAGYGRLAAFGRPNAPAHRVAYELANGPVPEGLVLDHLCRNPSCVNPAHLEAVTQRENVLRGKGRPALMAKATSCANGHAYTPENTRAGFVRGRARRYCRTCERLKAEKRKQAQPTAYETRLTAEDIPAIRELLSQGVTQADVAARYGVHYSTIHSISKGKTWGHV